MLQLRPVDRFIQHLCTVVRGLIRDELVSRSHHWLGLWPTSLEISEAESTVL